MPRRLQIEFRDGYALIPERAFQLISGGNGSERKLVLWFRAGGLCTYCRTPMSFTTGKPHSLTIDHVVPRSKGGTNALKNTVAACHACNQAKADSPAPAHFAK
jgi:5-methylcytosine-specific restriction endonuclease McrA